MRTSAVGRRGATAPSETPGLGAGFSAGYLRGGRGADGRRQRGSGGSRRSGDRRRRCGSRRLVRAAPVRGGSAGDAASDLLQQLRWRCALPVIETGIRRGDRNCVRAAPAQRAGASLGPDAGAPAPWTSLGPNSLRTDLLWALLAALVPVRAEEKPVSEDSRYTTLLREVADIQSFLTSFLGAVDAAGEWKHKVSVKRIVEGRTEWETVDRTEVLDPYVVDDDALYRAVTADANRRTGVAQAYAWLKGVIEKVRSRAQLGGDEAAPELRGKVQNPETGKDEPVEDLAFMDALIKDPQTLMVISAGDLRPGGDADEDGAGAGADERGGEAQAGDAGVPLAPALRDLHLRDHAQAVGRAAPVRRDGVLLRHVQRRPRLAAPLGAERRVLGADRRLRPRAGGGRLQADEAVPAARRLLVARLAQLPRALLPVGRRVARARRRGLAQGRAREAGRGRAAAVIIESSSRYEAV